MRLTRAAKIGLLLATLPMTGIGCASLSPKLSVLPSITRHRAETQYQAARDAEQCGRLEKARELYAALQRQSPNTPEFAHRMGVVCTQLQDYVTAGKYFEHARSLDPRNPSLLADMGYSVYLQKDYKSAEALLQQAVDLQPDDSRATNNLAMAIGFQGRYDESLAMFRRVNTETQSLLNVAFIQSQSNQPDAAMATYRQVLSKEPANKLASSALQLLNAAHPRQPAPVVPSQPVEVASEATPPTSISIQPAWTGPVVSPNSTTAPADLPPVPSVVAVTDQQPPSALAAAAPAGDANSIRWTATQDLAKPATEHLVDSVENEFELPQRTGPPGELPAELAAETSPAPDSIPQSPTEATPATTPAPKGDELTNVFDGDDNAPEATTDDMDELTALDWVTDDLAKQKAAEEAAPQSSPHAGDCLRGFCPVALRDDRRLRQSLAEFTSEYQGRAYRFSSAEALERFLANPDWYVPFAGGLDVIEVKQGHVTQGTLDFAVWFRHRLHMFSNADNLAVFRANPRAFASNP